MQTTTAVVDSAFIYILAFCFLLFALIIFFTLFFVFRYRRSRNPVPSDIAGNVLLEGAFIFVSLVLAMTMFVYGLTGFTFLRHAPPQSLEVKVTARQWSWLFTYNNGKKSTDLIVPQGKNISLTMTSPDVIHGFFIPAYRIKQDVVPSLTTHAWFAAASLGSTDILCTQYCGLQHSKMLSKVFVIPPADFDKWLAGEDVQIEGYSMAPANEEQNLLRTAGCMDCHSLDGTKLVGPTFKGLFGSTIAVLSGGKERSLKVDEAYIARSITDPSADVAVGYRDIMPSGKGRYSADQLHEFSEAIKAAE